MTTISISKAIVLIHLHTLQYPHHHLFCQTHNNCNNYHYQLHYYDYCHHNTLEKSYAKSYKKDHSHKVFFSSFARLVFYICNNKYILSFDYICFVAISILFFFRVLNDCHRKFVKEIKCQNIFCVKKPIMLIIL